MDHSKTVYLTTANQAITGLSPFTLTINPSGISSSNKIYKLEYNFGDGSIIDRVLTPDNDSDFLKTLETHVFSLTGNLQKTFNINVHAYQFNTSLYNDYTISLNLKAPPIESTTTTLSTLSSYAYFGEMHLVGTRMFGTENEVLYMFESINPNYILPVLVNWKARPIENIVKTIDNSYAPYKLLAPFENEFTTSIDTGTNIVTFPDVNAAPNPDYGSPNMALYEGDGIAIVFLGTVNGDWFNLANWETEGGNNPLFLPDEYVSVKVFAPLNVSAVNVGEAAIINFYENSLLSQLTVMASQSAIFRSNSYNLGTIDGNAYFLDNSYNQGFEPTLLLLNGEGADGSTTFIDSSTYNRILTYTGTPVITSVPVTSSTLVNDGLVFEVDAYGYAGDGSTWVDTVSGVVGTAQNSPIYVADSPSYFDFSGASQCFNFTRYNSAVNLNNNFTLETWVNVRGNNEWGGIISLATGGYEYYYSGGGEQYSLNTTNGQYFRFDINSGNYLNGITYTLNNWTHIVTTFESGVVKTYKNGILTDTQTIASTANTIQHAYLALGVNQFGGYEYFNGKIATVRIYNKVLSITEASQNFNATKERFGITHPIGSFMYFDGNSYIRPVSGGNDFAFGKEDFTIEAWIYPTRDNGTSQVFYDTRIGYYSPYPLMYLQSGTYLTFYNGSGNVITGGKVSLYDWTHVAVSRKNGKVKLFLNGVQTGGTANDTSNYQSNTVKPIIGGAFDNYNFKGFIEDFRVTKGIAKYTENYTLPTSSLGLDPYITGDVTGTAFFRDNSINYGTLTNTAFSGNCQNLGTVVNADVYYPTPYPFGGTVTGTLTYHGYIFGCDDSDASNYNPLANTNNGSCTYSVAPLSGLYAYWTLDESSGTRYDASENGFDLTESGTIGSGTGIISNAASFVGTSYEYLTNSSFQIAAGSDFTICGWVNLNSTSFQEIISQWYGGYAGNFVVTYGESNNDSLGFHVLTSEGDKVIYIEAPINEWVFFAMRWKNGVGLQAKINNSNWNVLSTTGTLNGKNWTTFMIGAGESYGYYATNGLIDEVGVWNRRLNEGEISYLYNSGAGRTYPF